MSQKFNLDDIMDELLDLNSFKIFDEFGRIIQESQINSTGKHEMIKNVWIQPKSAIQFITHKINFVPTGTIELSDLNT
jgi:hypothetical protein